MPARQVDSMLALAAEKEKSEQLEGRVNVLEQEVRNTRFGGKVDCRDPRTVCGDVVRRELCMYVYLSGGGGARPRAPCLFVFCQLVFYLRRTRSRAQTRDPYARKMGLMVSFVKPHVFKARERLYNSSVPRPGW